MNGAHRWALGALVVILVVLDLVLRVGLGLGHFVPDLIVVALLLAARQMRSGWAAGLGLLLGIVEGAVIPLTFGASALALAILGFLGSRSRDLFSGDSPIFLAFYLFAGKWLYDILLHLILLARAQPGSPSSLILVSPLMALYAAAAGIAAYTAYRTLS
ncbi:MAG: rod shape-determining protein MreD [Gemmatimonadetes bacterium]|nr:rod shape-determining protein MreD [Gemmatimonadota bacterium]